MRSIGGRSNRALGILGHALSLTLREQIKMGKPFDLLVYGASGFTGRLTALYLASHAPATQFKWAIAGRDSAKLQRIADEIKVRASGRPREDLWAFLFSHTPNPDKPPQRAHPERDAPAIIIGADAAARSARVIVSTVGPFLLYGEALVQACVEHGTHYLDLTGETLFVDRMIRKYGEAARANGTTLVCCSGFDSVPSDLGTLFLAREARRALGVQLKEVRAYVAAKGGVSGGTIASVLNLAREPEARKSRARLFLSPLSTPGDCVSPALIAGLKPADLAAPLPDMGLPSYSPLFRSYTMPWVMAAVNNRVVRRSAAIMATIGQALQGNAHALPPLPSGAGARPMAYSPGPFAYSETMLVGKGGLGGWLSAWGATLSLGFAAFLMSLPMSAGIALLAWLAPKPGEGPTEEAMRNKNWFQYYFVGTTAEAVPRTLVARVHGRDGGYGETAMMLAEGGLAMATQHAELPGTALGGGFLTPATAFGGALIDRLVAANMRFEIVPEEALAAAGGLQRGPPPPAGQPSVFARRS
jgi:short subunit dehydrogenase-like uncharacterized protein